MILPDTIDELEELIEDLGRELEDPFLPGGQRQALHVQLTKAASRLAGLLAEPRPDPEQQPGSDEQSVRAWARAQGFACSDSGPLPRALYDAYSAAHPELEVSS